MKDVMRNEMKNEMEKNAVRNVHVRYKMVRGINDNEVEETCVDLPLSQDKYNELADGLENNEVWKSVRDTLLNLTYLQGYNKLGEWCIYLCF